MVSLQLSIMILSLLSGFCFVSLCRDRHTDIKPAILEQSCRNADSQILAAIFVNCPNG